MPRIISIERVKRQKSWYELCLDNGNSFAVNDELILKYLLKTGKTLSNDELTRVRSQSEYLYLTKKALDILARRRITEKEIRNKLKPVKSSAGHIDKVITELKKLGFIDDYSYAVSLIQSSLSGSPRSVRYIRQKMYQKGVPSETADKAINDELSDYNEYEAALKLGLKKHKTVARFPELKAKKRIADFLRGRGFNWDVINEVINNLFTGDK